MKYKKICSLVIVIIIVMSIGSSNVSAEQCTDVVYYKKNSQKKIALTFDDGPHPTYTPEILDILKEKGKSKYWLYIQLGMSYQNFNKIAKNQAKYAYK